MNDDEFEKLYRSAIDEPGPPVPVDRIWSAVERRAFGGTRTTRLSRWMPLALAATLLLGIGLGYRIARVSAPPAPVEIDDISRPSPFVGVANQYLQDTEALLTPLAGDEPIVLTPAVQHRARELLSTTRLVLDTEITDPALRSLLEDLELVLAQMVPLSDLAVPADVRLVNQVLIERGVMPRLSLLITHVPGAD